MPIPTITDKDPMRWGAGNRGFGMIEVLVGVVLMFVVVWINTSLQSERSRQLAWVRTQKEALDLRRYVRNSFDCEASLTGQENRCKAGDFIAAKRRDGTEIFSGSAAGTPVGMSSEYHLRARCEPYTSDLYAVRTEYARLRGNSPRREPLTDKDADWRSLSKGIPALCPSPILRPMDNFVCTSRSVGGLGSIAGNGNAGLIVHIPLNGLQDRGYTLHVAQPFGGCTNLGVQFVLRKVGGAGPGVYSPNKNTTTGVLYTISGSAAPIDCFPAYGGTGCYQKGTFKIAPKTRATIPASEFTRLEPLLPGESYVLTYEWLYNVNNTCSIFGDGATLRVGYGMGVYLQPDGDSYVPPPCPGYHSTI